MHSCTCYLFVYFIIYLNSVAVAHQIYGVAHTINSANYMYFKALEKVLSLNHPACINIFTGTCTCLMKCRNFSHAVGYDVTSLKNWHIFRQYQWFSGYRCTVFTLDVSASLTLPTLPVLLRLLNCSGSPRIGLLFRSVSFIFFTFIHMPVLVVYWQVWDLLFAWLGCEEFAGSVIQYPIQFQWNIESPG